MAKFIVRRFLVVWSIVDEIRAHLGSGAGSLQRV